MCGITSMLVAMPFFVIFSTVNVEGSLASTESAPEMAKILIPGIIAATCYSIEALFIKHLSNRGVSGMDGGFMSIFFNGLFSVIILMFFIVNNPINPLDFAKLFGAGIFTAIAIVLVNVAVEQGEAGVAFSIGNSFPCWHSIYCTVVIGQSLSSGQIFGVILIVGGGVIISMSEKFDCCSEKKEEE